MADCDFTPCCERIAAEYARIAAELGTLVDDSWMAVEPLRDMVNDHQGVFVDTPCGTLPTLAETTGRIHNLGSGIAEWSFFESTSRTAINLPVTITDASKTAVHINSARLCGADYIISGSVLTLGHASEPGDQITVRTYGGAA